LCQTSCEFPKFSIALRLVALNDSRLKHVDLSQMFIDVNPVNSAIVAIIANRIVNLDFIKAIVVSQKPREERPRLGAFFHRVAPEGFENCRICEIEL
jgi:hypothetical protein